MKKIYILIFTSINMIIAYSDVVDSCSKIDKVISEMLDLDSKIRTEIDTSSKSIIKLVKD